MLEFLCGKKTYFIAAAVALASVARYLGYIDDAAYTTILGLLGAGGLASLRAGVTKSAPAEEPTKPATSKLGLKPVVLWLILPALALTACAGPTYLSADCGAEGFQLVGNVNGFSGINVACKGKGTIRTQIAPVN